MDQLELLNIGRKNPRGFITKAFQLLSKNQPADYFSYHGFYSPALTQKDVIPFLTVLDPVNNPTPPPSAKGKKKEVELKHFKQAYDMYMHTQMSPVFEAAILYYDNNWITDVFQIPVGVINIYKKYFFDVSEIKDPVGLSVFISNIVEPETQHWYDKLARFSGKEFKAFMTGAPMIGDKKDKLEEAIEETYRDFRIMTKLTPDELAGNISQGRKDIWAMGIVTGKMYDRFLRTRLQYNDVFNANQEDLFANLKMILESDNSAATRFNAPEAQKELSKENEFELMSQFSAISTTLDTEDAAEKLLGKKSED